MRPRPTSPPLGFHPSDRYRTVSEASILEMCHLAGWACERAEGSPGMALTRQALQRWIGLGLGSGKARTAHDTLIRSKYSIL